MDKLIIAANFRVFEREADGKTESPREYLKGMTVATSEIPDGHTAQDWIEKGLAQEA